MFHAFVFQGARVRTLSDKTIDGAIGAPGDMLVMFFAPWCDHCKEMMPQFEEAAGIIEAQSLEIKFAKLDASKYEDTAKKFHVEGYPSLRYFKDNEVQSIAASDVGHTSKEVL
jgi:protein disulfide-isomerase-like protein